MANAQRQDKEFSDEHWHLVGIGGTGMQALARYASERGVRVSGSDIEPSPALERMLEDGIKIQLGQDRANFDADTNLVVASQAISDENPELIHARELGVDVLRYPQLLGELMDEQRGVAVSGSHGKSTTSSMLAYMLQKAGRDASYLIGADVPQLQASSHFGHGQYFVAEACEYKRSFLCLSPEIGVVTNVDLEHTDYYYDLHDIQQAFRDFAEQIQPDGLLVMNADDPNSEGLREAAPCETVRFGIDCAEADYRAERIWRAKKHTNFDLVCRGENLGRFSTRLYGTHNIYNALAAIAAGHGAGLELEEMRELIAEFRGAARRLQLLGEPWNVAVLSDYAHHPREIRASIAAAQQRFPKRRIFCIFQPHQYSRTRQMLSEIADAFDEAWVTMATDIYAARDSEEDRQSVSSMDLVQLMNHRGLTAHYVPEFSDIEEIIVGEVVPQDVVLVMGAGSIWKVACNIVPRIEEKGRRQIAA